MKDQTVKQPRIAVDFNEMLEPGLVLLSQTDFRMDSSGAMVHLVEGLVVRIFEEDVDHDGRPDHLLAQGRVERTTSKASWSTAAKWCCRIDQNGVRHESEPSE
ncbi:MAG: hypothetical protein KKC79_00460 [Gammaproteobacteria bacterium]|nr:hypothetical protein [Gammaproteobacteria bacterium]MBU1442264.1 hypothetical protein [Gammaproteobacteria bacterium]MBU2407101.1 hypothetical protein [Gammaproteobacteria bacterium]